MTHLTMEQLLALREPGLEPGVQSCREHVAECEVCRAEFDRLGQRIARLKALPTLKPARDRFASIRDRARGERSIRRVRVGAVGILALAASIALAVVTLRPHRERELVAASPELEDVMLRSQQLERALAQFDPDRRLVNGRTVTITATLEDRVAQLDRQLEVVQLLDTPERQHEALRLWRERVGLLDALMDIHLTGARYVGF